MIQPSDIHTLTEFKRHSTRLLARLEDSGRPLVLTVDGRPKAVLLAVEAFEEMAALAGRADALEGVGRDLATGKLRDALELLGLGHAVMEQNLRREHPGASDAEIEQRLAAWESGSEQGEGAPGFLVRSPRRLAKLLRDPA